MGLSPRRRPAHRLLLPFVLASLLAACAADRKPAPESPAATQAPGGQAAPQQQPQAGYPAPPPPPPYPPSPTAPPPAASSGYAQPPSRQAALDLESAQRELDVAAGDCTNACRALSSMDRAAGRLCNLASRTDDEDQRRCADAKNRVYSARDKVRSTCGTCPDTSVDRNAPVPSR